MNIWEQAIVILKRATGIGYKSYPSLAKTVDTERAKQMEQTARSLKQELEYLDKVLAKILEKK